jgi:predicted nucleic acid-binding protein
VVSIADTSFVLALGNQDDESHMACEAVKRNEQIIYLPQSVFAEVGYMFERDLGSRALAGFLRSLPESKYRLVALEARDVLRTAEILEKYADSRIDFVDATIAAVAERLNITRILTLDQRDFQILRPAHTNHFEILPELA